MSYDPVMTPGPLSVAPIVTLPAGNTVRLGRIRPPARPQVVRLGRYFVPEGAVPPPDVVDYAAKAMDAIGRVYLNDRYGDCVIASAYHQFGLWTANESGAPVEGTDQEVLQSYHGICGPGDNGCVITAVLDYTRANGLKLSGVLHKIDDYCAVDWTSDLEVKVAIYLFGSLKLGINLPSAWTQSKVWDVTNSPIVGGHDVPCVGYNAQGVQIASWGQIYTITWAAFRSEKWLEEAYAPLAPDWTAKDGIAACGVDAAGLKAALEDLRGGNIPPIVVADPYNMGGFA